MPEQLRLLIDANAVGEQRVFGLESLAADPLLVRFASLLPTIAAKGKLRYLAQQATSLPKPKAAEGFAHRRLDKPALTVERSFLNGRRRLAHTAHRHERH